MRKHHTSVLPFIALALAHCGQATNEAKVAENTIPDRVRAELSCKSTRETQEVELCFTQIRHIPICEKTCAQFTSTNGTELVYECTSPTPTPNTGKCNYRNTWNPNLFN
jgi:hypothetical protein